MLDKNKIIEIARDIATANLTAAVTNVLVEPATDSVGSDALRITIVIQPGSAARLSGDAVLDTLVQIQENLRANHEERFPIIEYATEEELQSSGDS